MGAKVCAAAGFCEGGEREAARSAVVEVGRAMRFQVVSQSTGHWKEPRKSGELEVAVTGARM